MSTGLKKNTRGGLPANASDLLSGLQNVKRSIKTAGPVPYLRLLTDGAWVFGQDNTEVEPDSLWAVNPYTAQHGYACWDSDKSELLDEVMFPMTEAKPVLSELPDLGHDWKPQVSLQLQCVSGDDEDVVVLYKGTSKGQASAVNGLLGEVIAQITAGEAAFVPLVVLDSSHYQHKKHGRTYTPILEVSEWVTMDGIAAEGEAPASNEDDEDAPDDDNVADGELVDEEEVEEEAPKQTRGRSSKVKPAAGRAPAKSKTVEKKEPAPATRRRRRSAG